MSYVEPCTRCGWKYGWHICLDLPEKEMKRVDTGVRRNMQSREQLAILHQARDARWSRERELNANRDKNIVARYKQGDIGVKNLAKEFGIAYTTTIKILHRAVAAGEVVMRKRGANVRHGARVY